LALSLLTSPLLFSLELHIPPTGESQRWTLPRDMSAFTPAERQAIVQHLQAHVLAIAQELRVTMRFEATPKLLSD